MCVCPPRALDVRELIICPGIANLLIDDIRMRPKANQIRVVLSNMNQILGSGGEQTRHTFSEVKTAGKPYVFDLTAAQYGRFRTVRPLTDYPNDLLRTNIRRLAAGTIATEIGASRSVYCRRALQGVAPQVAPTQLVQDEHIKIMHTVIDMWEQDQGSSLAALLRNLSPAQFEHMKAAPLKSVNMEAATLAAKMNACPGGVLGHFKIHESARFPGLRLWKVPKVET